MKNSTQKTIIVLLILATTACSEVANNEEVAQLSRVSDTKTAEQAKSKPSQADPLEAAKQNFKNGHYGNAERLYREAVEANPRNAEAWLGLAATYDRLKRFENANRAYTVAQKITGFTPRLLNNLGFHYILRGEFGRARKLLIAAQKKDPDNQLIRNNLELLAQKEQQKSS